MNRRRLLRRLGANGPATAGVADPSATAEVPDPGIDRELDVSEIAGTVPLASVVDGDLDAQLNDEYVAQLPGDLEASDLNLEVGEATGSVVLADCEEECCGTDGCRDPGACCICIECE